MAKPAATTNCRGSFATLALTSSTSILLSTSLSMACGHKESLGHPSPAAKDMNREGILNNCRGVALFNACVADGKSHMIQTDGAPLPSVVKDHSTSLLLSTFPFMEYGHRKRGNDLLWPKPCKARST